MLRTKVVAAADDTALAEAPTLRAEPNAEVVRSSAEDMIADPADGVASRCCSVWRTEGIEVEGWESRGKAFGRAAAVVVTHQKYGRDRIKPQHFQATFNGFDFHAR